MTIEGVSVEAKAEGGDEAELPFLLHAMLLDVAGQFPDGLVRQARTWLAAGDFGSLARAVAFEAARTRTPMTVDAISVLADLLVADGQDGSTADALEVLSFGTAPAFAFSADPPVGVAQDEAVEAALLAAVAAEHGANGLWGVWRSPTNDAPWPVPRRVFLVESLGGTDVIAVAARLQETLSAAGEVEPQVEVFPVGYPLPVYQRFALSEAALLWALEPQRDIEVAAVFDSVDAQAGPGFDEDHERIDDTDERQRLIAYLEDGEPLLVTTALMPDVVDPTRGEVVPMNFLTDGTWVWTDASAYYLWAHRLAPPSALVQHIRSRGYVSPPVDAVAAHLAMEALADNSDEEPTWTYDLDSGAVA